MLIDSIKRNSLGLGLFAVLTAGTIAVVQATTSERINENKVAAATKALAEMVSADQHDGSFFDHEVALPAGSLNNSGIPYAFQSVKDGKVNAVFLPVITHQGYSGDIRVIIGVWADGTLAGARVVEHKETPGLGDKVETRKSNWIMAFTGKSLGNTNGEEWKVKKDGGEFDQFAGATITPRAVVGAIHNGLEYFAANKDQLLTLAPKKPAGAKP
ncbi:electron transport complex subunit RsxG [Pokkaliibacter sp. CJK22405]|uniref:electron transport complex subunit RsxG n=1 Tax=Pokkaliibacter sp. CJK22405 TaxID=3384615 RepID=UPI0039847F77